MKKNLGCVLALSVALHSSGVLYGQQIYSLETKNLRLIYYSKAHEFIVPHLARCFENAFKFHSTLFNFQPTEKVNVLLQDFGDYGGGGAAAVPLNYISIGIAPMRYVYETAPANERMNWLMNHEMVHIVALDKSSRADRTWQKLFMGKVLASKDNPISMFYSYLTTPREYTPRWYHEGIATFLETWMAGGLGRALGSYDEMVFRTMVRDSSYIYDAVGLESEGKTVDFQGGANSYLYGTRIMSYLANKFGPERLLQWISRTDDSDAYYSSQFKKVFGSSLDDEWSRWIAWEHDFQRTNLDSIRQYPVTSFRPISRRQLGSVSRLFYDPARGKIYCAISYPGQVAHIAAINIADGSIERICDVKGAALYYVSSLTYDPSAGKLYFTTDNNKWRDLNVVDVKTGEVQMLMQDVRTGDFAFNQVDKSIWGVRHFNGISTLVRIPPPYTDWNTVYPWDYGKDIYDIEISPDGSVLTAALAEVDGSQRLIKLDISRLRKGDATYEVLYDFENSSPANFVFSPDGKYLFGTTYFTGVSNVVRYDFEKKKMEWLTNCETGFFRPVPYSSDSLMIFQYTGNGFVPGYIAIKPIEDVSAIRFLGQDVVDKYSIVTTWKLDPPTPQYINIDSLTTYSGEYSPSRRMGLVSGYPIVEGYKDFAAFGMQLNFSDALLLSKLDLSASYSPNQLLSNDQRLHVSFNYHYWRWDFKAAYNGADFYDLFGPTKKSRKGYSLGVQYKEFLVYDDPKSLDYSLTLTKYGGLERLPEFQNITTSFDNFYSFNGRLNYQFPMKSIGAVDDEKGIRWQFLSYNNYVNGKLFSRVLTNFDYGILLPLDHSSVWLRSSAGYSFGERKEPLANFYFGGFGNNWVDVQDARRFREFYSFPGVDLNAIGGTNYGKLLVEWTLPPLRFRRLGFLPFYSNWAQLMLFSSAIATNMDNSQVRRTAANAGAQLDFKLVIFSTMESTFSVGYAAAFEKGRRSTDEFMVSLKILK